MALIYDDICGKVAVLVQPLLDSLSLELVDIEFKRAGRNSVLCLFIDKEGGITLDNCADVSRELSVLLDVEDFIPVHYTLEVSSPGLDRPLKKAEDFIRFAGKLAKIVTAQPHADQAGNKRKTFLGNLEGFQDGAVRMKLAEGQAAVIPLELIAKANLEYEF